MNCMLCNVFFWLGHFVSRGIVNHWPDSWERSGEWLAGLYSRFMSLSMWYDIRGGCGEWK